MKLKQRKVPVLADAVILVASKKFDMKQAFESLQSALRYYHIGFSFQKHQNQSLHYAKLLTVKAKAEQKLGTNQNQSKTVSDAVSAPWSWELTAGENHAYPRQDQACYQIGGTLGALALPQLELWSYPRERGWHQPMARERIPFTPQDPLALQIRHFCAVIRDGVTPLMSGREGMNTLRVVEAVKRAAETGLSVAIDQRPGD